MARIASFLSYLHSIMIQVPQHGYHNISRVVQPQIRCISESFLVGAPQVGKAQRAIQIQTLKMKGKAGGKGSSVGK